MQNLIDLLLGQWGGGFPLTSQYQYQYVPFPQCPHPNCPVCQKENEAHFELYKQRQQAELQKKIDYSNRCKAYMEKWRKK